MPLEVHCSKFAEKRSRLDRRASRHIECTCLHKPKGGQVNDRAQGLSEDWLSVWIGLLIFALSLGVLGGADLLGWVVSTQVWSDASRALGTTSKAYASLGGVGALIATYVGLLVVLTAG